MRNFKIKVTYGENDNIRIANATCKDIAVAFEERNGEIKLKLKALAEVKLISVELGYDYNFDPNCKIFCNGYQSWTTSKEYSVSDKQKGLLGLCNLQPFRTLADTCGDYQFVKYHDISGIFHSFSYGYVRIGQKLTLVGSLNERNGYTIISFQPYRNRIKLSKDIEGHTLAVGDEYDAFDVVYKEGNYDEVFDAYFENMAIAKPRLSHLCGYTSWYNYFGKISEDILLRDLDGLSKLGDKADIFQIDDGYQSAVGDWLDIKQDKFPNGMKFVADKIHDKGYMAGLWLAPTLCQKNSKIVAQHRDWLVTEPNSTKLKLGGIAWGGAYILNLEKPEVKDYLRKVFKTVFDEWGFDLVKLDFLYSACLVTQNNKSRGQLMCEAMDFFRECAGEKYILGCGVPLAPSFGKVDMCRISCDVDLSYKDKFYNGQTNQEIVSAQNAISNTIFRRNLDGRAFVNDPDVFFMRNENLKFNNAQKKILSEVNNMCGNVLFVSDDIGKYDDEQLQLITKAFAKSQRKVTNVEKVNNNFSIDYEENGEQHNMSFDLRKGKYLGRKDNN